VRKESVSFPDRLNALAIPIGEVFPVDPGGIADDVVKLADGEGGEEIFEEAGPDAVFAFLVELLEVVVGGLEGFGVGRGPREVRQLFREPGYEGGGTQVLDDAFL
jgi:hypothetical protein